MSFSCVGDTDVIAACRDVINHQATVDQAFEDMLLDRQGALNIPNDNGDTPLHVACSPQSSANVPGRDALIQALLKLGANAYLVNRKGQTPLMQIEDELEREAIVANILQHRLKYEHKIPSVAPLAASRLMKRAKGDRGAGIFSNVLPTWMYYLYKGAVYLWDIQNDVEHVVYQPRDNNSRIASIEHRLSMYNKRKSFVARGGDDPSFDITEEETAVKELKELEGQVHLVQHFTIAIGLRATQADGLPVAREGVIEWVQCNTGALIAVHLNRNGLVLREGGQNGSFVRRKSHVCGAAASYPTGKVPYVQVMQHSSVRFTRRPQASKVCCAIDGLHGTIGYVMATKGTKSRGARLSTVMPPPIVGNESSPFNFAPPNPDNMTPPPTSGSRTNSVTPGGTAHRGVTPLGRSESIEMNESMEDSKSPRDHDPYATPSESTMNSFISPARRGVQFLMDVSHDHAVSVEVGGASGEISEVAAKPPPNIFAGAGDVVFRVVRFDDMLPKEGFDDCMVSLCNKWEPFCGMQTQDFIIKEAPKTDEEAAERELELRKLEPVCVQMCGAELFLLFLTGGVVIIDAQVTPARKIEVSSSPEGNVIDGVGMHIQRFRSIRTAAPQLHFAQVSEVVELFQLIMPKNPEEPKEVIPILRLPKDRVSPMRFTPVFHPAEDSMVVLYQSNRRQELATYNFNSRKMRSVCRLPKPSSLRFYHPQMTDSEGNPLPPPKEELAELCFAFNVDGTRMLRYNVSMHVMSIYSWDDVYEIVNNVTKPYVNTTWTRDVIPVAEQRRIREEVERRKAAKRLPQTVRGDDCVWFAADCMLLQKLQEDLWATRPKESIAQRRARMEIEHKPLKEMYSTLHGLFKRVVMAHGGRLIKYQAPQVEYDDDEEEEGSDTEPIPQSAEEEAEELLQHDCPIYDTTFFATFFIPLECARASIKFLRDTLTANWSAEVLGQDYCKPVYLDYKPKTTMQKQYGKTAVDDTDAVEFLQRGPPVRAFLHSGHTASNPILLKAALTSTIGDSLHGVVAVEGKLMRSLVPLAQFFASQPVAMSRIGSVTCMVPGELDKRLAGIAPPESTSPTRRRLMIQNAKTPEL